MDIFKKKITTHCASLKCSLIAWPGWYFINQFDPFAALNGSYFPYQTRLKTAEKEIFFALLKSEG